MRMTAEDRQKRQTGAEWRWMHHPEHNRWTEAKDRSIWRCWVLLLSFQHWQSHRDTTSNSQSSLPSSHLSRNIKSTLEIGTRVLSVITSSQVPSSSFRILHKLKKQSRNYIHQHMTVFIHEQGRKYKLLFNLHTIKKETDHHSEKVSATITAICKFFHLM